VKASIDLNADVGELPEQLRNGQQEALLRLVSSANVACGGHAGDEATIEETLRSCQRLGVTVGAHPGYPDPTNFGRITMPMSNEEIAATVEKQILTLAAIANRLNCPIVHVKPHGALYNDAARNSAIACAIANGVARWRKDIFLVGLAGSVMLDTFTEAGFVVAAEAFADRGYQPDGSLRPRNLVGAMIEDPQQAANQALRIFCDCEVVAFSGEHIPIRAHTLCIHGDGPHAIEIATAVRSTLLGAHIEIKSMTLHSS
jgi:UPF0271 protein